MNSPGGVVGWRGRSGQAFKFAGAASQGPHLVPAGGNNHIRTAGWTNAVVQVIDFMMRSVSQDVPIGSSEISVAQLNDRSREIFRQIVESYLATGEPVGSRNLSRIIPM